MSNETKTKVFRVEHSRILVDTYLVEAETEEDAEEAFLADPQAHKIVETDTFNDIVEVVG